MRIFCRHNIVNNYKKIIKKGEGMTAYLLSIIGVVMLGVLVDIVVPNGQMNKYIKSMFGIFTVMAIILPIPKIINSNYDFSNFFYDKVSIEIDQDFLQATNKKIVKVLQTNVEKSIEKAGFLNVSCEIESNLEDNVLNIKKVTLNLKNMVISGQMSHINKYTEIVQAVQQVVNVSKEQIVFDE